MVESAVHNKVSVLVSPAKSLSPVQGGPPGLSNFAVRSGSGCWPSRWKPGYASGIISGILILAIFAMFEKKRQDVLDAFERIKQWEA